MYRNAKQYNFDLGKVVLTGNSAGGHLALTTGVLPASAGMERQCPGDRGPGSALKSAQRNRSTNFVLQ